MYIAPIQSIDLMPDLGSLQGSFSSQAVLDKINNTAGAIGGVFFGQIGNPIETGFSSLMNIIMPRINKVQQVLTTTNQQLFKNVPVQNVYKPITCEDELVNLPTCMQLPILMHEPVRQLLKDEMISGWGMEEKHLPQEDAYGRLINNGTFEVSEVTRNIKEPLIEWTWESCDPVLTLEDIDAIEESRRYVSEFLSKELAKKGSRRDPTDLTNKIGKLK